MQEYLENKKKAILQKREAEKKLSFRAYRRRETANYIKHSKEIESKAASFKKHLEVINAKTNSIVQIQHNPLQRNRDDYLWFLYNNKILEEKLIQDGGYCAIFLTTTMPTKFHKFSATENCFNPSYDWKASINKGYKIQNQAFREIYKNFRVDRKHEKIFFCKAFEPHKNMTAHMHCILYVKKEHYDKLITHLNRVIAKYELGKTDLQLINDITRSISYVLKYINKTNNPENEEDFHFFNGWKKKNKIRVYTHSNMELERYIFKKVNSVLRLSEGLENQSPIAEVLKHCDISINTYCKTSFKNNSKDIHTLIVKIQHRQKLIKEYIKSFSKDSNEYIKLEQNLEILHNQEQDLKNQLLELKDEATHKKEYKNVNARYEVVINRTREKILKKETFFKFTPMSYFEANRLNIKPHERYVDGVSIYAHIPFTIEEIIYTYKIDSFTIRDTFTDEILYSKKDFMLLDDFKYQKYLVNEEFVLK